MKKVVCPYCGCKAAFVCSETIYGRNYGMVYCCLPCDAYVGVHRGTNNPLGRLANAELRYWKKRAHAAFDPIWKEGRFKGRRNDAYKWLAAQMGLSLEKTHIGMFDVAKCKQVMEIMEKELSGLTGCNIKNWG